MRELLRRVHVREDPELTDLYDAGEMPAVLRVTLTDGTVHEVEKSDFVAHPARPVTWEGLEAKFDGLARDVYDPAEREAIIETVRNLEEVGTGRLTAQLGVE